MLSDSFPRSSVLTYLASATLPFKKVQLKGLGVSTMSPLNCAALLMSAHLIKGGGLPPDEVHLKVTLSPSVTACDGDSVMIGSLGGTESTDVIQAYNTPALVFFYERG